jgi:uracil-DNA glycosylase family 4
MGMSRIFINYRRQDTEGYVGRLYDYLAQHFERDQLFMDVDSIPPGADFVKVLEDAVSVCDVFIAMIGPQWLTAVDDAGERRLDLWNDFVRIEIASALNQNKLVIPVLVGRARMPSPADLPDDLTALARRNAIELSHQRFAYDVDKLIAAIKEAVPPAPSFKPLANSEVLREKEFAIKAIRDDLVNASESPLYQFRVDNRYFPVIGEGYADANIMLIGQAPGKTEAETGRPFCGPSGEVLDEMLRGIKLRRENVFLTNLVLDRTPDNRNPNTEELNFYAPFLDRMIDVIQPAVIATLGLFSMKYLLKKLDLPEKGGAMGQLHGKLIKTKAHYGEIHVVPLYHPAVVLYSASQKATLRQDFEKLKLFI